MSDASHPRRRRNTAEEIRQLGATQSKARTRGFIFLTAGVLSAGGLLGAFLLLSGPQRASEAPSSPAQETDELRPETQGAQAPSTLPGQERSPKPGARRANSIAALARPTEPLRPAVIPEVRGQRVDLEELARSLANQKKGAVQLCFERELKRDPRLTGSAMVRLTLEAPHKIGAVTVHDNLARDGFTKCVRTAMRSVDFPPLAEDVTVELPFALKTPEL